MIGNLVSCIVLSAFIGLGAVGTINADKQRDYINCAVDLQNTGVWSTRDYFLNYDVHTFGKQGNATLEHNFTSGGYYYYFGVSTTNVFSSYESVGLANKYTTSDLRYAFSEFLSDSNVSYLGNGEFDGFVYGFSVYLQRRVFPLETGTRYWLSLDINLISTYCNYEYNESLYLIDDISFAFNVSQFTSNTSMVRILDDYATMPLSTYDDNIFTYYGGVFNTNPMVNATNSYYQSFNILPYQLHFEVNMDDDYTPDINFRSFVVTDMNLQDGYKNGYNDGVSYGYLNGYNTGYQDGSHDGYQQGYANGSQLAQNATFNNLFNSIADTPLRFLYGLFSFDLFGTSMIVIILTLLTAMVVFGLVKKFWK